MRVGVSVAFGYAPGGAKKWTPGFSTHIRR